MSSHCALFRLQQFDFRLSTPAEASQTLCVVSRNQLWKQLRTNIIQLGAPRCRWGGEGWMPLPVICGGSPA